MLRSIRVRLQLWYAGVLTAVVVGFACLLYFRVWHDRHRAVRDELASAIDHIDSALRVMPEEEAAGRGMRSDPGWPDPARDRRVAALGLPRRPGPPRPDDRAFIVWRGDGTVLKAMGYDANTPRPEVGDRPRFYRAPGWHEAARTGAGHSTILVGVPVWRIDGDLRLLAWQLAGAGALVLAVGLIGGAVIGSRIFRPLAAISATASRISADNLAERIDAATIDSELAGLAGVLNATFDRLQAAFDRQARFTADASHELRTPLTVIRTQAELALLRPRNDEEYREALASCARAAERMAAIVDGLLILARADASRLELRKEPVRLDKVVQEAVALIEPLARQGELRLEAELSPLTVSGDAEALARVANTLLSNAVAYNRDGGLVRVTLTADGGEAILSVADNGVGIAAADLPHLFERFYRVGEDRSRATGGTGLGLAICKAMAEAHGGSVSVESEPGVGSTFRVRLPLE